MKQSILGTGLRGMVGSRITQVLKNTYAFKNLSLSGGFDIRDAPQVYSKVAESESKIVLHLAAKSDVDECQLDKDDIDKFRKKNIENLESFDPDSLDWKKWKDSVSAYAVNVHGTNNIAHACKEYGKRLVYISTDFVFEGGTKKPYKEDDFTMPVNFYGRTKRIGEIIVQHMLPDALILRIAFPYGSYHPEKKDFVAAMVAKMRDGSQIEAPEDGLFTPTLIDDIARALNTLLASKQSGIFHIVGPAPISPYEAALAIATSFGYDKSLVKKTTHDKFYKGRAPRPQFVALSSEKAAREGIVMRSFQDGLSTLGAHI